MHETLKKIAFHTLGCKLNFSESSSIGQALPADRWQLVARGEAAHVHVINSCTVTKNAEKRCRALIRQIHRREPHAHIAVIGCFAQLDPDQLAAMPGVSLVLGTADKFDLGQHLETLSGESQEGIKAAIAVNEPIDFHASWSSEESGGRTRSFLKIQDGCDYFCTYCTIPMARGRSRSAGIAQTLEAARLIARGPAREIVLSGVNIGDFGKGQGEKLSGLLSELCRLDGIERIRISSVEPDLLSDEIIDLVAAEPRLMPHFHIPLQAGSDAVLQAMGRRYNTDFFAGRVSKIRSLMPRACIAADIIVGFPGETPELFDQAMAFVRQLDISYLHVFPFSVREGTPAEKMADQVEPAERQHRSRMMQALSEEKKKQFYLSNQGATAKVLWEHKAENEKIYGFTENYIRVVSDYETGKTGRIDTVILNKPGSDGVYSIKKDTTFIK